MNNTELSKQYINLLKKSLLNQLYIENEARLIHAFMCTIHESVPVLDHFLRIKKIAPSLLDKLNELKKSGNSIVLTRQASDGTRTECPELRNVTELSHTMLGSDRLDNLQYCIETVIAEDIKGDFIETGIWRGGACIFMRGVLKAYGISDRTVWAADSFEGVPAPTWEEDAGFDLSKKFLPVLSVPLEEVKELFSRYDLLDGQVRFIKGWFKDSLSEAPIEKLAILRLDGDLYESTMDALNPLYSKVASGGFVIVDDYHSCPPCKQAIHDFRAMHGIVEELVGIDGHSVFWRKA